MNDFLGQWYPWLKAAHVIAVIAWMAGMFYLPRLYVYHSRAAVGSDQSETFKAMELKLLRVIINPAMIATWVLGGALALTPQVVDWSMGWIYVKLAAVTGLSGFHGYLATWRKDFANDRDRHSEQFYRVVNEVPTILMVVIVIMVVVKPF